MNRENKRKTFEKGSGTAALAQRAAERLDHFLFQRVQHFGEIVQLVKGHLPAGKLPVYKAAHI